MRVEQDIVDLDVAMDHALTMGVAEGLGDVDADADDKLLRQDIRHLEALGQAGRVVIHGEIDGVAIAPNRIDLDDVGVAKLRSRGRFAPKSLLEDLVAGELRLEDLQCDVDLELGVERLVDPRKPAGADQLIDPVLPQGLSEVAFRHYTEPLQGWAGPVKYCAPTN